MVQIIVMALDPIIFLVVLLLNFISLDNKKIIIYGVIGGLIAEIMVAAMNYPISFGDTILLRIIAANLQSLLAYYTLQGILRIKKQKSHNLHMFINQN